MILGFAGCGTKQAEEDTEDNLETQENQGTPFYDEGGASLNLIQGDRIIGEALSADRDSVVVIADIEGKGREWDIVCRKTAGTGVVSLQVRDERGNTYMLEGIAGLSRSGQLPSGNMLEVAIAPLVDPKRMEVLCAVGDGESAATLSVFHLAPGEPKRFVRIGALEGEAYFTIRRSGRIEAPYGTRGTARRYAWNGTAFEELPEPAL